MLIIVKNKSAMYLLRTRGRWDTQGALGLKDTETEVDGQLIVLENIIGVSYTVDSSEKRRI
jgi:hypothetical protein